MRLRSCEGCGAFSEGRFCDDCESKRPKRLSMRDRGYTAAWDKRRKAFLLKHPICDICGGPANVADHFPLSRKQLVAMGIKDPDADEHLRPLCHWPGQRSCHSAETARLQPGGWNKRST